jgi:Zn-dependent protease
VRDSIRLGQFAGIPIGLHWSIGAIAAILVISLTGTVLPGFLPGYPSLAYLATAVVVAVLFIASIAAHELGHSVVAVRNGVQVQGITLFALGGVARLGGEAPDPGAAARIAAAGPAVSIAVGVAALGVAEALAVVGAPELIAGGMAWLGLINLSLAVFNLLPVLPLDGGRIFQALLWKRSGNRDRATITAATVGRLGGWGLVLLGLWQVLNGGFGLWTMLIGGFIIITARAEELRARVGRRFRSDRVIDVGPGREATPGGWAAPTPSARRPGHQEQAGEGHHGDPSGIRGIGLGVPPTAGVGEPPTVGGTQGVEDRPQHRSGHPGPYRIVTGQVLVVGGAPQIDLRRLQPPEIGDRRR